MRNKNRRIFAMLLSVLVICSNLAFVYAEDEIENIEEPQIEEVKKEEPQKEEVKKEEVKKEEVKEEVKEEPKEEIKTEEVKEEPKEEAEEKIEKPIVEETEKETSSKNNLATTTKKFQKEEEEKVAYYSWHSEDEQGKSATPKFINVNPNVTEQDFETNQSIIVLEAYDKDGNNIKSKNQYIPINKIERTIEGDIHHPGLNSVVETLTYNNAYSETIYHTLYTFITVNYIEKATNKTLQNWNYEVISWGFKFSEKDENISAITADMNETEKTNFYNQFYSPHQDTRYQTWNVSDWDKINIDGYDYVETVGAVMGTFTDLIQQHNIFVYYQEHIDDSEPIPEPEPEPTPQPEPEPTPTPEPTIVPSQPTQKIITSEPLPQTEEVVIASTNPPTTTIDPAPTPKAEPEGSWALINLIAVILSCICALVLLFVRKDTENDEPTDDEKKDMRKMVLTKTASAIIGIGSIIIFILTEDMSLPMVLTDKWTFLMILLLIIEIVNIFIIRQQSKGEENDDNN